MSQNLRERAESLVAEAVRKHKIHPDQARFHVDHCNSFAQLERLRSLVAATDVFPLSDSEVSACRSRGVSQHDFRAAMVERWSTHNEVGQEPSEDLSAEELQFCEDHQVDPKHVRAARDDARKAGLLS